jgi:beta-glucosidase
MRFLLLFPLAFLLAAQEPYRDTHLSVEARVNDLVARMTLEEKASQLLSDSPAIDRLHIPAYNWWNECLHGVARAGRATVFPETIGMAATWDTRLLFRVSTAISDEARAKHEEFVRRGKRGIYEGLTFWTPNINLFRDPRWGRGMETYGEDPLLTGKMAVAFIRGLQGDDPKYLKTVATAKHYAVHSGPESTRHTANVVVDEQDLRDSYLPQFEMAIREGGAQSVMCAYNSVDGKPACANPHLLQDILREEWKFPGYVVSDCGAIGDIYQGHRAAASADQGVAMAIHAGTDLDCGLEYTHAVNAVKLGFLKESEIDTAVKRLFTARFRLGMFDPPEQVKWAQIPYSVNESKEHADLAVETARESIVLLKNQRNVLPLSRSLKTLAVIGPNADDAEVMLGNYNGQPSHPVTPLAGIHEKLGAGTHIIYARGTDIAPGMPSFEAVPNSALFTSDSPDKQHGLKAEYFSTSNFNGRAYLGRAFVSIEMRKAAVIPKDPKPLFTRTDPNVDFDWRDGAPRHDLDDDNFGVRWTGFLAPAVSGKYELGATGLNSYELSFNGKMIAHRDNVHERGYEWQTVDLEAGKLYPIQLNFHEVSGDADIRLVWEPPHADYREQAIGAARASDAIVLFLGLSPRLEGEEMKIAVDGFAGGDRVKLGIPQVQQDLLESISALGKPVILVLLNGSALSINWARDHVPGIVELWYPGQAGGTALADVLFGDYNPGGRLPLTFYRSEDQLPAFDDYHMKGRTYRYFQGEPLFPFGYGLSYTTFTYTNLTTSSASGDVAVSVEVKNTGNRDGDEVVQVYSKQLQAGPDAPIRSLAAFDRVHLKAGERKTVHLTVSKAGQGIELSVGGLTKQL